MQALIILAAVVAYQVTNRMRERRRSQGRALQRSTGAAA